MTRPYAEVIGDPIAHSKSPLIHGFWLRRLGIDAEYRAWHVKPEGLADYFAKRREDPDWRGCNVTIPHKLETMRHVDVLTAEARHVGAVNTVSRDAAGRLIGTNTDVDGVAEAMGTATSGNAVVIGSGGAARAAFSVLAGLPGITARVLARSPEKAAQATRECRLAAQVVAFEAGSGAFSDATLVINATQLGMTGQAPMPAFVIDELARMASDGLVFDMVYSPLETELLAAADRLGLRTSDGLVMLVGQAAAAFEHFFGKPVPREHDAELRKILTS